MKASDIQQVAVIGAGTMGAGIAGVLARSGCTIRLYDQDPGQLPRGLAALRAAQRGLRRGGQTSAAQSAAALRRVEPCTCLAAACKPAQLVVESISENLAAKLDLFAELDRLCPPRTILASNTSGLSITALGAATRRATRVAGMHFWNPPHLVPLVEVVQGQETSPATARLLLELARRLGKRPILVRRDVPGFVGNRLQFAVFREALHLLAEGVASPADIDAAMSAGPGLRYGLMGPLRSADLGGLDVFAAISGYLFAHLSAAKSPPKLLGELVKLGRLGAKSGGGFYDYSEGDRRAWHDERDRVLLAFQQILEDKR